MHSLILFFLLLITFNNLNAITLSIEEKEFIKNNPIINVGAETDWPPFDYVEDREYTGISRDYLELIEKRTGLKFNYIFGFNWKQLLEMAKNKEIDLLPILNKTTDREKYLSFTSNSHITTKAYLFSLNKPYKSFDDLYNKIIAIPKGHVYENFIKEHYPEIKILSVENMIEAIDSVLLNKADALISNIILMEYLIRKNNISGIYPNFLVNSSNNLHMAFRNDYPILKNIIDKSLDSINDLEKNEISSKWINKISDNLTFGEKEFIKNHKSLRIANELGWIPYDYFEDEQAKGYVIDYVKLIFSKLGIEPIFVTDKWQNLLERYSSREIDVFPVIGYNDQRAKIFNYTSPYINQELAIITKINKFNLINIDDLNGKKIAMVKNWNLVKVLKENYPKINIVEFDTLAEAFNSVEKNETDATIQNTLIANYNINKTYYDSLKILSKVHIKGFDKKLYMGINKDLTLLPNIINKTASNISLKEFDTLNKKWFNNEKNINFTQKELDFIEKTTINVAYIDNWAPLSFVENNKAYGLGFDFWQYVIDKANLKTNTVFKSNFSDALNDIKQKTNDIILTTSKTPDREKYAIFSDIYYKAPIGIATLLDKNYIPDASYLLGKKIAVGKNYTAHKLLKKEFPTMDFVFINNMQEGLELLSNNKIYALVDNMPVLAHNIQKNAYDNIKISGSTGIDFNLQMMIRDDYKILQSIINKVLVTIDPNDRKLIYDKWSKADYFKPFDYSILWKYFLPLIFIIFIILYKNRQLVSYQKKLKKIKNELEDTLKTFRTLVNLTIEGIIIVSNKKIIYSNDEVLKIFNIDNKELFDKSLDKLFEINSGTIEDIIKNSESQTYETIGLKEFKTKFPILVKSKKVIFENQDSTILSIIDMSEIKNKESLLIQQSKMASLGEMMGNIAHQWRQPLSLISTAASGMKIQKEFDQLNDKIFYETIDNITNTTSFLSQTINDFQDYLKEEKIKKDFYVNASIEKILNIIKSSFINHSINVVLDLEKELVMSSYENELNQVFLNVFNNAKDALINIDKKERYLYIKSYKHNDEIIIEIIDNAGGINESIINKIFEPYFTTKHRSQGTGLGLYMTHNIITRSMNGEIKITNVSHIFENKTFDKSTKVKIILPIS